MLKAQGTWSGIISELINVSLELVQCITSLLHLEIDLTDLITQQHVKVT